MIVIFLFIFGICLGSFLGVVIDRVPQKKTILYGRSVCDFCGHTLSAVDLVPVFSFLFLRGKCRYCKKKLSPFYLFIEIFTGLIMLGFYIFLGQP
ncbi:MAG TPA: prepilin peptidase, partial [Candidatus Saccharimonadales bacterium]|nr:prepilin peptidase [Candidatus Saccharimonadales bacterium]